MMITRWAATFMPQQRLREATTTWIAPEQQREEAAWGQGPGPTWLTASFRDSCLRTQNWASGDAGPRSNKTQRANSCYRKGSSVLLAPYSKDHPRGTRLVRDRIQMLGKARLNVQYEGLQGQVLTPTLPQAGSTQGSTWEQSELHCVPVCKTCPS